MTMEEKSAKESFTIHDLPIAERPRERLQKFGSEALSAQEILAVILGRGIAGESIMVTAQRLLSQFGGLKGLAQATVEELSQVKGIGLAKACQIKAAFELANRLERAAIMSANGIIDRDVMVSTGLEDVVSLNLKPQKTPVIDFNDDNMDDRERVIAALEQSGWVQAKAARLLNMTPRQIAYRILTLDITMKQI